jgi:TatD DNase family protein
MPKYIDIHCHINFKAFKEDGKEVIQRALDNNTWLINVGSQYSTSRRAIEIAEKYSEGVYACIGLHPIHLEEGFHDEEEVSGPSFAEASEGQGSGFMSRVEIFDYSKYLELALNPKVVAIGECGLDYYHLTPESIEKQKKVFIEQVKLAQEVDKPLMLHIRNHSTDKNHNAYADIAEILEKYPNVNGVSHCFGGSVEDMKRFIDLGIYISFAGNITYKNRPEIWNYEEVIRETPLNHILTDTDSPYLSPVPFRGKRNEPLHVQEIVKKIAEIKGLPETEVAQAILENARRFFRI